MEFVEFALRNQTRKAGVVVAGMARLLSKDVFRWFVPTALVSLLLVCLSVIVSGLQSRVIIQNATPELITLEYIRVGRKSQVPDIAVKENQTILPHQSLTLTVPPRAPGCLAVRCRFDSPPFVVEHCWGGFSWGQRVVVPIKQPRKKTVPFDTLESLNAESADRGELSDGWLRGFLSTNRHRIGIRASSFE